MASELELPLWLDSIGTIIVAYCCGPVCGAIVGASVNFIDGFHSAGEYVYLLASVSIGIIVGLCAQKGMFRTLFGTLSTSFFVSLASVCISVPLNWLFLGGYTNNKWGDGVIDFLLKNDYPSIVCYITGQFYLDFLDKTLILLMLYLSIRSYNRIKKKKHPNSIAGVLLICIFAFLSIFPATSYAAEKTDYSTYVQTVYDHESGLPGGVATDIEQTKDGVLWIGTYNGLYCYSGNGFRRMDEFASVKNVNCLYTDEEGRLWIGTNDSDLSVCINDEITKVMDMDAGLPANSVKAIAGGKDGNYYVGTSDSLAVVTLANGISLLKLMPEISQVNDIVINKDEQAVVITDEGILYIIDGTDIVLQKECEEEGEIFTCCAYDRAGNLYAGTSSNKVEVFDTKQGKLIRKNISVCGELSNIKELKFTDNGETFICADNGIGYIDPSGKYHGINTNSFNSSIDHMLIDYQGNLWFTSSRHGLLKMCRSVFMEVYERLGLEPKVVNAIIKWNGNMYFGTDNGMEMANARLTAAEENWLTDKLKGVRIRHMMIDSKKKLWIATSGKGVWQVSENGSVTVYDSSSGTLGDKFRMSMEMPNNTILLAGDSGITYVKNGKVSNTIGIHDGLSNPKILCMVNAGNNTVLAGTDGSGIAVIKNGKIIHNIYREDGLKSGVVLRIFNTVAGRGYILATGNGLCYMDGNYNVRPLENFPYYNNFNIVRGDGDNLFVLSSAGIYVVNEWNLLSGKELEYTLLDSKKGLRHSLTTNAWTYMDDKNNLYLPQVNGVTIMNIRNYDSSVRSYRMVLRKLTVDGKDYTVSNNGEVYIPKGAKKIEIAPEVINYSVNDPYVSIFFEGIDDKPQVLRQSELVNVVYNNIPAGSHTLTLSVFDKKDEILYESRCCIIKEFEIYEYGWFRFYLVAVFILIIIYIVWMLFRTQIQRTLNLQKRELEIAQKHIQMSNETIFTIAKAVDAKDSNTSQHSQRVSEYAVMIASHLGYSQEELEELRKTALLHDIGKIGVTDNILNKPSRLTEEEYDIMKSHVVKGSEILKNFTSINNIADGALYHHERYDGKGYVNGLKGEEIPLNARIIGIADAFDAMTANRVYRHKLDFNIVIEELKNGKGTQFDPILVDIMLYLIETGEISEEELYNELQDSTAKKD